MAKLPEWATPAACTVVIVVAVIALMSYAFTREQLNYCMSDCAGQYPKATDTVEESAAKLEHCRKLCELRKR